MNQPKVADTVRIVHTSGLNRIALFATVLSVHQPHEGSTGTNNEPTLSVGYMDSKKLHLVGGVDWHKAYERIPVVRHVSHDEAQTCATEYCWTDLLPNDGGPIDIDGLEMEDLEVAPVDADEPVSTIGTIVYINHANNLEVFHGGENLFRVHFDGEDHDFTDGFSAKVFVDAKPAQRISGSPMHLVAAQKEREENKKQAMELLGKMAIHLEQRDDLQESDGRKVFLKAGPDGEIVPKKAGVFIKGSTECVEINLDDPFDVIDKVIEERKAKIQQQQPDPGTRTVRIAEYPDDANITERFGVRVNEEEVARFVTREEAQTYIDNMQKPGENSANPPQDAPGPDVQQ